jgi:L-ascorbate metabolism protein UlaG (beta-lactamase superfamily)
MKPLSAVITHLFHSGFAVETINHFLIFDYSEPDGTTPSATLSSGSIDHSLIKSKENVYVFVTHSHSDHFMESILMWQKVNPNIQMVFSVDVPVEEGLNVHKMKPYEKLKINEVSIESFGSTDEGVSYFVKADQLSFFHAGDLNWWHWKEFTPEQQKQEEQDYKREVQLLVDKNIDVAFVPVDPRLEDAFHWAGKYFIETVKPSLLIPMHFGLDFDITREFAKIVSNSESNSVIIEHRGQQILFAKS